jgi:hypothetical protein
MRKHLYPFSCRKHGLHIGSRRSVSSSIRRPISRMNDTVTILLSHQPPEQIERMLVHWSCQVTGTDLVLAYGGHADAFERIGWPDKLFIDDPRLRTRDHQRERQSYTAIFQAVSGLIRSKRYATVWFMEFDHLPLEEAVIESLRRRLSAESADVLGFHLRRVDRTNSPHYLNHATDISRFIGQFSIRTQKDVVLSMFGSGSFWTREAFDATAAMAEPFPIYLEIYLPTVAHHLGFRLRDLTEQNRFVRPLPESWLTLERARREGALTIHPLKSFWSRPAENLKVLT